MAKQRRKEKNYHTKDIRVYRRKIRHYPQRVELGKTEQVYRRIAKFTEKVNKKRMKTDEIFRTFAKFTENKMKNVLFGAKN